MGIVQTIGVWFETRTQEKNVPHPFTGKPVRAVVRVGPVHSFSHKTGNSLCGKVEWYDTAREGDLSPMTRYYPDGSIRSTQECRACMRAREKLISRAHELTNLTGA